MSAVPARGAAEGSTYDPRVALECFKAPGGPEEIAEGRTIFAEKEKGLFKRNKIYLLLNGEVGLLAGAKPIGAVKAGEIFGELAAISNAPRTATAVAKSACKLIALDDKEFQAALRKQPGFALMLMSVMIRRLRETIQVLEGSGALAPESAAKEAVVFDPKHLAKLLQGLSDEVPVYYDRNKPIMEAGQAGPPM